jgi:hypothetical protein
MQKRLSLADLKANMTTNVVKNTEVYTGGDAGGCHWVYNGPPPMPVLRDKTRVYK